MDAVDAVDTGSAGDAGDAVDAGDTCASLLELGFGGAVTHAAWLLASGDPGQATELLLTDMARCVEASGAESEGQREHSQGVKRDKDDWRDSNSCGLGAEEGSGPGQEGSGPGQEEPAPKAQCACMHACLCGTQQGTVRMHAFLCGTQHGTVHMGPPACMSVWHASRSGACVWRYLPATGRHLGVKCLA